jgi:anti-anti-sigma factor
MKAKLTLAVGRRSEKAAVLRIEGSVDPTTFKQFDATFRWLNKEGIIYLVLEMSRMTYISSGGLSLLVKAKTIRDRRKGGAVVLVRPQTAVMNIMKILGLTKVFRITSSVEEAMLPPQTPHPPE